MTPEPYEKADMDEFDRELLDEAVGFAEQTSGWDQNVHLEVKFASATT